jgi:hypothetical protein
VTDELIGQLRLLPWEREKPPEESRRYELFRKQLEPLFGFTRVGAVRSGMDAIVGYGALAPRPRTKVP